MHTSEVFKQWEDAHLCCHSLCVEKWPVERLPRAMLAEMFGSAPHQSVLLRCIPHQLPPHPPWLQLLCLGPASQLLQLDSVHSLQRLDGIYGVNR
jgi:hypothetical protein